jgi:hypothetical protein
MTGNMGKSDRIIRILVAAAVAVLYFTNVISGTLGVILLVLSGILLITGIIGTCPLYLLFGLSTRTKKV